MKKRILAMILGISILSNSTLTIFAEKENSISGNTICCETGEKKNEIEEEITFTVEGVNVPDNYVLPKDNTWEFLKNTKNETLDCAKASISLPSSYNGKQYQTSVKKQYGNTCWIYANIAAVEASMIKNGLANNSLDLSELHHIFFYYNRISDPLGNISNDYVSFVKNGSLTNDFASYVNGGGEKNSAIDRLLNRVGPVSESLAPFTSDKQGFVSSELAFGHNAADVVGCKIGSFEPSEASKIKELIYTHGAVTASYYSVSSSTYYKNVNNTMSYYYPYKVEDTNHAIVVVGWDDNYSASNFAQTPPGNGAWLCKNSWGTDNVINPNGSPVDGYFWLSYYDGCYTNAKVAATAFIVEKTNTDKYLYQYDGSCYKDADLDKKSYLNIFTTKGMNSNIESIDAVSVDVGPNASYNIKIYVNPVIKEGKIFSYDYVSQPQHCSWEYTGTYKTRLNKPIYVNKGDTFAVEIVMDNPSSFIAYSKCFSDDSSWYYDQIERNTFFYQTTEGEYEEFVSGSYSIKAFTNDATFSAATSVSLSDKDVTLGAGETHTLTANVLPSTALQQVRYSSTNTNVATVDGNGKITAVGKGTCQIKVTSWDKKAVATCNVKVSTLAQEINAEPSGLISIQKGQKATVTAKVLPENADDKAIAWGCGKTSVAVITQDGSITGKNTGITNITALNIAGGLNASIPLYVVNPVTKINLQSNQNIAQKQITLYTNDNSTATLSAKVNDDATISGVDVKNSNPIVASYDEATGQLKALQNGKTELTFSSKDGAVPSVFNANGTISAGQKITEKVTVTVGTKAEKFSFDNEEIALGTGVVTAPSGSFVPSNVSNKTIKYTSSNPEVVDVNANGYLVGKKPGTAVITGVPVLAKDGTVKDTITVTVTQYVDEVQAPDSLYMELNEEVEIGSDRFNPIALPATASNRNLSYELKCTDGSIKLNGNTLKGTSHGQAQLLIKAQDSGEVKKTVNIYCVQKAAWLWLVSEDMVFSEAGTFFLDASLDENATERRLTWSSSDTSIATVSDGTITLTGKAGTTTITVSTIDGSNLSQSVKITFTRLVQSLTFDSGTYYMTVGEKKQANVQIVPQDATNSSNPYVATVENGVIVAMAEGSTIITATTNDDTSLSTSTFVSVSKAQQTTEPNTPQEEQKEETKNSNVGKEFVSNGLKYKVMTETEVRCIGPKSKTTKKVTIPTSVTYNNISYQVTAIKDSAFLGCKKLSEVNLPTSLENIGKKAFKDCTKLTTITIPNNVTSIGSETFSGCSSLKSVKIGAGVTSIGSKAFYKCKALKKVTIPSKVKTIGSNAFNGCTAMTSVTIGKNVTSIGSKAFYNCKKLKKINITSTKLKTIGKKAFFKIAKKCKITIPASKKKAYKKLLKGKYSSV